MSSKDDHITPFHHYELYDSLRYLILSTTISMNPCSLETTLYTLFNSKLKSDLMCIIWQYTKKEIMLKGKQMLTKAVNKQLVWHLNNSPFYIIFNLNNPHKQCKPILPLIMLTFSIVILFMAPYPTSVSEPCILNCKNPILSYLLYSSPVASSVDIFLHVHIFW